MTYQFEHIRPRVRVIPEADISDEAHTTQRCVSHMYPQYEQTQCDGCRAGLPVDEHGHHFTTE